MNNSFNFRKIISEELSFKNSNLLLEEISEDEAAEQIELTNGIRTEMIELIEELLDKCKSHNLELDKLIDPSEKYNPEYSVLRTSTVLKSLEKIDFSYKIKDKIETIEWKLKNISN